MGDIGHPENSEFDFEHPDIGHCHVKSYFLLFTIQEIKGEEENLKKCGSR